MQRSNVAEKSAVPTLLQVFNSEYGTAAKNPTSRSSLLRKPPSTSSKQEEPHSRPQVSVHGSCQDHAKHESTTKDLRLSPNMPSIECISQSIKQSVDNVTGAISDLRLQTTSSSKGIHSVPQITSLLETSLTDALLKFDTCLKNISASAWEASSNLEEKARSSRGITQKDRRSASLAPSNNPSSSPRCFCNPQRHDQPHSYDTPQSETRASSSNLTPSILDRGLTGILRDRKSTSTHIDEDAGSLSDYVPATMHKEIHTPFCIPTHQSRSMLPSEPCSSGCRFFRKDAAPDKDSKIMGPSVRGSVLPHKEPQGPSSEGGKPSNPYFPPLQNSEPLLSSQDTVLSFETPNLSTNSPSLLMSEEPLADLPLLDRPLAATSSNLFDLRSSMSTRTLRAPCHPLEHESSGHFFDGVTGVDGSAAQFCASREISQTQRPDQG